MRAAIINKFGGTEVLEISEVERPQSKADELLVKVNAAAVNPKDTFVRKGRFRIFTGKRFPMQSGYDFAGEVVAVGERVSAVKKGESVFGMLDGWHGRTCAEFVVVKPSMLAKMPDSLSYEEAAAIPLTASTALQALRDEACIEAGFRVGINGASGGVGSMAVQISKLLGAHVTAVSSKENHEFLRRLGADTCIDYHDTGCYNRSTVRYLFRCVRKSKFWENKADFNSNRHLGFNCGEAACFHKPIVNRVLGQEKSQTGGGQIAP
jgi:NADPH:quinone reductase-like Zn-dependent oxidoreductase